MANQEWISTGDANRILNCGVCPRTFRDKFRDCIPWKVTPGGQYRWLKSAVEELADVMPEAS